MVLLGAFYHITPQTISHLEFNIREPVLDGTHFLNRGLDDPGSISFAWRCIFIVLVNFFLMHFDLKWVNRLVELNFFVHL